MGVLDGRSSGKSARGGASPPPPRCPSLLTCLPPGPGCFLWPSSGQVQGLSRCPWTPDQGFGQMGGSPALSLSCLCRRRVPPAGCRGGQGLGGSWEMLAAVAAGQSPVCAPHSCAIAAGGGGGPAAGSYFATSLPSSHEMPRGRAGQGEHRTAPQVCGARAGARPRARSFRPLVPV